uniref:Uncharacterized protein n=1 Tax=Arundo donax TaxID=35708 RepID=A0A0A9F5A1_ARUDO
MLQRQVMQQVACNKVIRRLYTQFFCDAYLQDASSIGDRAT